MDCSLSSGQGLGPSTYSQNRRACLLLLTEHDASHASCKCHLPRCSSCAACCAHTLHEAVRILLSPGAFLYFSGSAALLFFCRRGLALVLHWWRTAFPVLSTYRSCLVSRTSKTGAVAHDKHPMPSLLQRRGFRCRYWHRAKLPTRSSLPRHDHGCSPLPCCFKNESLCLSASNVTEARALLMHSSRDSRRGPENSSSTARASASTSKKLELALAEEQLVWKTPQSTFLTRTPGRKPA